MSTISITGFENRIAEYALDHGIDIKKGKRQRLANRLRCRLERMTDLDRERLVMHSDPVVTEVLHHMFGTATCRQCGQEAGQ